MARPRAPTYTTVNDFTVTIPGGSTRAQATFTLTPTDDDVVEGDETLSVSGSASGLRTRGATVTITDDDGRLGTVPALTVEDATAAEGDSLAFTVTLDKAVSGGLTVTPSFTDGTATSDTDYTENTAALTFTGAAGETETFKVATTEDAVVESDETFTVSLAVSGTTETGDGGGHGDRHDHRRRWQRGRDGRRRVGPRRATR